MTSDVPAIKCRIRVRFELRDSEKVYGIIGSLGFK